MYQISDNHIHFNLNLENYTIFKSLEVLDRGSETQLQVTENFNALASTSNG